MKTYATLGPACCRADLLTELLDMGLTGFRLNLSHTTLTACRPWTEAVQQARATSGRPAELIVDMRGPELRMGPLSRPVTLTAGETVILGPGGLPVEPDILAAVAPGQEILLDDGLMALRAESCGRAVTCTVTRGGVLESRKSITLPGVELCRPALTEQDLLDLDAAAGQGVTAVMQPFVRSRHELEQVRRPWPAGVWSTSRYSPRSRTGGAGRVCPNGWTPATWSPWPGGTWAAIWGFCTCPPPRRTSPPGAAGPGSPSWW